MDTVTTWLIDLLPAKWDRMHHSGIVITVESHRTTGLLRRQLTRTVCLYLSMATNISGWILLNITHTHTHNKHQPNQAFTQAPKQAIIIIQTLRFLMSFWRSLVATFFTNMKSFSSSKAWNGIYDSHNVRYLKTVKRGNTFYKDYHNVLCLGIVRRLSS